VRKGPLIAAIVNIVIGIAMTILGAVMYNDGNLYNWPDWVMWFGIIIVGIGLIVLIVTFIKKPGAEEKEQTTSA